MEELQQKRCTRTCFENELTYFLSRCLYYTPCFLCNKNLRRVASKCSKVEQIERRTSASQWLIATGSVIKDFRVFRRRCCRLISGFFVIFSSTSHCYRCTNCLTTNRYRIILLQRKFVYNLHDVTVTSEETRKLNK